MSDVGVDVLAEWRVVPENVKRFTKQACQEM